MPKKLSGAVEAQVQTLSREGYSIRTIKTKLKKSGTSLGKSTIADVINSIGQRRNHKLVGLPTPENFQPRKVRTNQLIKKIDKFTDKENPPNQNETAKMLRVSQSTVGRAIRDDLNGKDRRKVKVHQLKESHIANRKKIGRASCRERV